MNVRMTIKFPVNAKRLIVQRTARNVVDESEEQKIWFPGRAEEVLFIFSFLRQLSKCDKKLPGTNNLQKMCFLNLV